MGDVSQQKEVGVRIVHRVGEDENGKPVIVSEALRRQGEKEDTKGKPEKFDRALGQKKPRDPYTIFGELEIKLDEARKGIKNGRVLSKEEFGELLALVRETPDGKRWELGLMVGKMIVDASEKTKDAEKIWQELTDKTKPTQREESRKENPGMAMVYDYIVYYDGDPNTIKWQNVLDLGDTVEAIEANRNIPDAVLDRLVERAPLRVGESVANYQKRIKNGKDKIKTREKIKFGDVGGWESKDKKLRAFENMLGMQKELQGVDVRGFWEKQLLGIVEDRLEAMRSPTAAKLAKDGKKMEIIQSSWEKLLGRGRLSSRLSFEILDPHSELGEFLNQHERLDFWRGKAAIDRQWSLYTGVPIQSAETRAARTAGEGLFSVLNEERVEAAEVSECCGPEAELQISKDDKVCDALNILYHLAEGKTYQQSLNELKTFFKNKYNFEIDLTQELPRFITDAVRIAYFYGLDIRANGNKDARYKSWLVGEFENLGWVTDVEGKRINLLGDAFALKPDDMMERGWFSGRNASLAYNSISGDPADYFPNQYPYQKTAKWQTVFFYCLGLDRYNDKVRHYDLDPNVKDDNILPGTKGKFERFDNDNEDHRKVLFDRLKDVREADKKEQKPSWDNDLRDKVDKVLQFFEDPAKIGATDVNQIWYNSTDKRTASIWQDLNIVLNDPRAWGLIGDFRDSEMQKRSQTTTRYDMLNSLIYDCKAVESAGLIVKLLKKIPNTLPEELETMPGQIEQAFLEMRHRYNSELTFRNINVLFGTVAILAIERFLQVQIPSRELIQKMTGEYKLFEWKRIYEGPKGLPQGGEIEYSTQTEFFLRLIEEELEVTETGLVARFDDAIRMMVGVLVMTEAFDWATARSIYMEKHALIYNFLAGWLNPRLPVESYRLVDVTKEGQGQYRQRNLTIQDSTYRECFGWKIDDQAYKEYGTKKKKDKFGIPPEDLEEFFEPIPEREAGKLFGGCKPGKVLIDNADLRVAPSATAEKVEGLTVKNNQKVFIVETDGRGWTKVIIGRQQAWIQDPSVEEVNNEINGLQRTGEKMHEGGRFVWNNGWHWITGTWKLNDRYPVQEFTADTEKHIKGYSRIWNGIPGESPWEKWSKDWVVEKIERKVAEGKIITKVLHQVRYPFLAFKSEEHRQRFYLHRFQILFRLITGQAQAGYQPGQAPLELDPYFEAKTAFIGSIIRQVHWLDRQVNFTIQKQLLRAMDIKAEILKFNFGEVSKVMKETFEPAKVSEIQANITHRQKEKNIEVAFARRKEEETTLNLLQKVGYHALQWKIPKLGIGLVDSFFTAVSFGGVNLITKFVGTNTISHLLGGGINSIVSAFSSKPMAANIENVVGVAGEILILWALSKWFTDARIATGIIKKINEVRQKDFGDDFAKLAVLHPEDTFFPVQ